MGSAILTGTRSYRMAATGMATEMAMAVAMATETAMATATATGMATEMKSSTGALAPTEVVLRTADPATAMETVA